MKLCSKTQVKFIKWLLIVPLLIVLSSCNSKLIRENRLSVDPNPLVLTYEAQTQNVNTTNLIFINSQITTDIVEEGRLIKNDWIEIRYNGRNRAVVSVTENTTPNNRSYEVWLSADFETEKLLITQEGKPE